MAKKKAKKKAATTRKAANKVVNSKSTSRTRSASGGRDSRSSTRTMTVTTRRRRSLASSGTATLEEQNVASALDGLRKFAVGIGDAERVLHAYIIKLEGDLQDLHETSEQRIERVEADAQGRIDAAEEDAEAFRRDADRQLADITREHDRELGDLRGSLTALEKEHAEELEELGLEHETSMSRLTSSWEEKLRVSSGELERLRERVRILEGRLGIARDIIIEPFSQGK